jgi:hypothetical protein
MLLSIDQKKIDRELKNSTVSYVVSPYNLETPTLTIPAPSIQVSSTGDFLSPELERFRDRVMSIRTSLVERGEIPATSSEGLEQIIDEVRGRA